MIKLDNTNFKGIEFTTFEYVISSWIKEISAKGIISKSGKYGDGTFHDSDIAW